MYADDRLYCCWRWTQFACRNRIHLLRLWGKLLAVVDSRSNLRPGSPSRRPYVRYPLFFGLLPVVASLWQTSPLAASIFCRAYLFSGWRSRWAFAGGAFVLDAAASHAVTVGPTFVIPRIIVAVRRTVFAACKTLLHSSILSRFRRFIPHPARLLQSAYHIPVGIQTSPMNVVYGWKSAAAAAPIYIFAIRKLSTGWTIVQAMC